MYNITLLNNKILKIYDSQENSVTKKLILRFSISDYSFNEIKSIFDNTDIKEALKRIIKTTSTGMHVATFDYYTNIISKSVEKVEIVVEKAEDIPILNGEGQETTTTITTTETQEIELIVVVLKYEDPTKVIVEKLNEQINPSINADNCTLDELKRFIQKKNSDALETFLEESPLLYTDNKYYGVSKIDRDEMTQQYLVYQLNKTINPDAEDIVKWHSKGTKCTPMAISDFATLALAIYAYAEPYYEAMQEIKETIMSCKTKEEVLKVKIFEK